MRKIWLVGMMSAIASAHAETASVMPGDHKDFGRLVIEMPGPLPASVKQEGTTVQITTPDSLTIETPPLVPRNVRSFRGGAGKATLEIARGAQVKEAISGRLIIIDVLDRKATRRDAISSSHANPAAAVGAPARPEPMSAARASNPSVTAPAPARPEAVAIANANNSAVTAPASSQPAPVTRAVSPAATAPAPAHPDPSPAASVVGPVAPAPATASPDPVPVANVVNPPLAATASPAATQAAPEPSSQVSPSPRSGDLTPPLPFTPIHVTAGPSVGAAAWRMGDLGMIVFDDAVSTDVDHISGATVVRSANATIMTMPLPQGQSLSLERDGVGWLVRAGTGRSDPAAITAVPTGLRFDLGQPGRSLAVRDPVSGQLLLVGTSRQDAGVKARIANERAAPGYVIMPTWLGVALEVTSDQVDLSAFDGGFLLDTSNRSDDAAAIVAPVNPFGIPNGSVLDLSRQLPARVASAAIAPPRSRGAERAAAARTMLALGMADEAQALLLLAANDDPAVANDPKILALQGIAAVLAGRPEEASALDNGGVPASADLAMWRSLRDAETGKPAAFPAGSWRHLASYPEAIQSEIAPTVLQAAVTNGENVPDGALAGPGLALVRAHKLERRGRVGEALALYDEVAKSRDERQSVNATVAETELKLTSGQIAPAAAAEILQQQSVRWRGDRMEARIRLRAAQLRQQAGQWRAAADILKETETLFPDLKDKVADQANELLEGLLTAEQSKLSPLDFIDLTADLSSRLPPGDQGDRLASLVADKLGALDLPARALPVLQRLHDQARSDAARAQIAVRIAQMQLDAGQPGMVADTLGFDPAALEPELAQRRVTLLAQAEAALGKPESAADLLASVDNASADALRGSLFAKAQKWQESASAFKRAIAQSVPSSGELTDQQQDLILQAASSAVHGSLQEDLRALAVFGPRLTGARANLFRVLTQQPVQTTDDLPRAGRELAASRDLPQALTTLKR